MMRVNYVEIDFSTAITISNMIKYRLLSILHENWIIQEICFFLQTNCDKAVFFVTKLYKIRIQCIW